MSELLTRKEQDSFIFKARKRLHDTAGDPVAYNAEEFVSFSRFILDELLEAQLAKVRDRPDRGKLADTYGVIKYGAAAYERFKAGKSTPDNWAVFQHELDQISALFDGIRKDYSELILEMRREFDDKITLAKDLVRKDEREKVLKLVEVIWDNACLDQGISWCINSARQALKEGR